MNDTPTRLEIGAESPSFLVIFIHGFAMYKRPYAEQIATLLGTRGQAYLYDLPGHGLSSEGFTRMAVRNFVKTIARDVSTKARVPVILAGESLGCTFLASIGRSLMVLQADVKGFAMFAPPLLLNVQSLTKWAVLGISGHGNEQPLSRFSLDRPLRDCVGDKTKLEELKNDPLVKHSFGLLYLVQTANAICRLPAGLRYMTAPTLMLQGTRDPLVAPSSLTGALALCGSCKRTGIRIDGARHSLLWDHQTPEVLRQTRAWMTEIGL